MQREDLGSMRVVGRLVALTLAVVALGLAATGCGGDDEEATTEPTPTMTDTEPGDVSGAEVFQANCESCHGLEGEGGGIGPNLQTSPVAEDLDQVLEQVRNGGGVMPAFEGTLSEEEIQAVGEYVVQDLAPRG